MRARKTPLISIDCIRAEVKQANKLMSTEYVCEKKIIEYDWDNDAKPENGMNINKIYAQL